MLIVSALLSLALVVCIYIMHKQQEPAALTAFSVTAGSVLLSLVCLMPTFVLHAALISLGTLVWKAGKWQSSSLLAYMALSAIAPYGYFTYLALEHVAERQRLLNQYAFESMESRVPAPKKVKHPKSSKESEAQLDALEQKVKEGRDGMREFMLEQLHHDSVEAFIESPGFGRMRRIRPSKWTIDVNLDHRDTPIPQPNPQPLSTVSERDLKEARDVGPDALREMHLDSVLDFVNPRGFGLVVSREKVAGFQSHQFGAVPRSKQWKVQTVELVGLLMHEEPLVYVSNELPRMDMVRKAPTRTLNTFESVGLKRLQQGEDLFIRETPQGIRMLGALRAVEQCIQCHGGERGDLLGAFSYCLTRTAEK